MTLRFSTAVRSAEATAIVTDAGSGSLVKIYSGTQPASVATAATGTLLAQLTNSTTLGTVSNGVLTFNAIGQDVSADNTGTAGWFRVTRSDGTTGVIDGSVSASGGGGELQLNSTAITSGGTVSITSASITMGNP